jgi:hypothetical protein
MGRRSTTSGSSGTADAIVDIATFGGASAKGKPKTERILGTGSMGLVKPVFDASALILKRSGRRAVARFSGTHNPVLFSQQPRRLSAIIKRSAVNASLFTGNWKLRTLLTVDYVRRKLFWPLEGFSFDGIESWADFGKHRVPGKRDQKRWRSSGKIGKYGYGLRSFWQVLFSWRSSSILFFLRSPSVW